MPLAILKNKSTSTSVDCSAFFPTCKESAMTTLVRCAMRGRVTHGYARKLERRETRHGGYAQEINADELNNRGHGVGARVGGAALQRVNAGGWKSQ